MADHLRRHLPDAEAIHRPCAQCGATDNVVYLAPDMDIAPLCVVCRVTIFWGDGPVAGRDYTEPTQRDGQEGR